MSDSDTYVFENVLIVSQSRTAEGAPVRSH